VVANDPIADIEAETQPRPEAESRYKAKYDAVRGKHKVKSRLVSIEAERK
jgi:hypothetical protein